MSASTPVDVLVNNAGVDGRALGVPDDERDVLQLSAEHFLDEIRINALGPMLLTRRLVEPLRKAATAADRQHVVDGRVDGGRRAHRPRRRLRRRRRRRST